jgi:hypothetical protein
MWRKCGEPLNGQRVVQAFFKNSAFSMNAPWSVLQSTSWSPAPSGRRMLLTLVPFFRTMEEPLTFRSLMRMTAWPVACRCCRAPRCRPQSRRPLRRPWATRACSRGKSSWCCRGRCFQARKRGMGGLRVCSCGQCTRWFFNAPFCGPYGTQGVALPAALPSGRHFFHHADGTKRTPHRTQCAARARCGVVQNGSLASARLGRVQ